MDALELLEEDHKLVIELFKKAGEAQDEKEKRKIFGEIYKELETHARIEETVFYPAMQENDELKHLVLEALEEHKQVKGLLREIKNLKPGSEKFEPKLQVLMDNVQHHAEEEEEGKMFPKENPAWETPRAGGGIGSGKGQRSPKGKLNTRGVATAAKANVAPLVAAVRLRNNCVQ